MNELFKYGGLIKELYRGQWSQDRRKGFGVQLFPSGFVYAGEWSNNAANGIGKIFYPNGCRAKGSFVDNNLVEGSITFIDGSIFNGKFSEEDSCWFGTGKLILPGGISIEGVWDKRYLMKATITYTDKSTNRQETFATSFKLPKKFPQNESEHNCLVNKHLQNDSDFMESLKLSTKSLNSSAPYTNKDRTVLVLNGKNGLIINNELGYLYSGTVIGGLKFGFGLIFSGKSIIAGNFNNKHCSKRIQLDYRQGQINYFTSNQSDELALSRVFYFNGFDLSIALNGNIISVDLPFMGGDQIILAKPKKYFEDCGLLHGLGKGEYAAMSSNGKRIYTALPDFIGQILYSPQITPFISFAKTFFSIAKQNPSFVARLEKFKSQFFQDQAPFLFEDLANELKSNPDFLRLISLEKNYSLLKSAGSQIQAINDHLNSQKLPINKSSQIPSESNFDDSFLKYDPLLRLFPRTATEESHVMANISQENYDQVLDELILKRNPLVLPIFRKTHKKVPERKRVTFNAKEIENLELWSLSDQNIATLCISPEKSQTRNMNHICENDTSDGKGIDDDFSFNEVNKNVQQKHSNKTAEPINKLRKIDNFSKPAINCKEKPMSSSTTHLAEADNRDKNFNSFSMNAKPMVSRNNKLKTECEDKCQTSILNEKTFKCSPDKLFNEINDESSNDLKQRATRSKELMQDQKMNDLITSHQLTPPSKGNTKPKSSLEKNSIIKAAMPFQSKDKDHSVASNESSDCESFRENISKGKLNDSTLKLKAHKVELGSLKKSIQRINEFITDKLNSPPSPQEKIIEEIEDTPEKKSSNSVVNPIIIELSNSVSDSSPVVLTDITDDEDEGVEQVEEKESCPLSEKTNANAINVFLNLEDRSLQEMDKWDLLSFANFSAQKANFQISDTFSMLKPKQIQFSAPTIQDPLARHYPPRRDIMTFSKLLHRQTRTKLRFKFERHVQTEDDCRLQVAERKTQESAVQSSPLPDGYCSVCGRCSEQGDEEIFFKGVKVRGSKNGLCTIQYQNGDIYTGVFVNNKKHGDGLLTSNSNQILRGHYDMDKPSGKFFMIKQDNVLKGYLRQGKFIARVQRPFYGCEVECDLNDQEQFEGVGFIRCHEFELQCKFQDGVISQSEKCKIRDLKSDAEMEGYLRLNKRCEDGFFENETTRELFRVNLKKAKLRSLDSSLD